jgi:hypothetical protein
MTDAKNWDNLSLRLRDVAYKECRGHAVTIMKCVCWLVDGKLEMWSEPSLVHLEPSANKGGLGKLAAALEEKGDGDGQD